MSVLVWLLVYAAFFYLMMRFGCGAHMVHGGHGGHGHGEAEPGTAPGSKDPVCGMQVDPSTGYVRLYNGRAYRICSRQCLDKFDSAPERFAA